MPTLAEFTAQIKGNIRRGSSQDANIPGWIRKGALWIERNHTLQYMMKFAEVDIDPDVDEDIRYVTLLDTRIKAVKMFRWVNTDGTFAYMSLKDPQDYVNVETGQPAGYWLDGVSRIVLSSTPDSVLHGELHISRYSAWPTADSAHHWLLDFAEDVLEARTMMNFAKSVRDAEAYTYWKGEFDLNLPDLYSAEYELSESNTDDAMAGG
jgi:hypothetical protein